jgi:histidinol dehydrogenase
MALGTSSIPSVDKVVGPGNKYVTAAKRRVYGLVDIESLTGPSELLVMCDDTADARLVAADLLAQAEHDPDARVYLFTPSRELLQEVQEELSVQLPELERSDICRQAMEQWGGAVQAEEELLWDLLNSLAPEHLSLQLEESMEALENVRHAGAVFIGANSAVSFGDYTAGPNHVLPTDRTARFSSPLGVHSFMKRTNVLGVSRAGLQELAEATQHLASAEGLTAHARAVQLRVSVDDGGETVS